MSSQSEADYPPRLRRLIACVFALAAPVFAGAVISLVVNQATIDVLTGAAVLGLLAFLADLRPVPLDESRSRSVSLAFVFVLASTILYGWALGVVIGAVSVTLSQLVEHRPIRRTLFNGGAYALAAFAAAAPCLFVEADQISPLATTTWAFVGGALFVLVNVGLVCLAVSFHSGTSFRVLLIDNIRHAGAAFLTMASLAALAVVLWGTHPLMLALLAGPLAALTLYQRSALDWRIANRAAHTDSLTGLGNHRAFELDLDVSIGRSIAQGRGFTLCYVDVDLFKEINDTFGHPVGDACLEALARVLSGEAASVRAFRFGGDEFALVIERPLVEATAYVERLRDRVAADTFEGEVPITISAGLASFPAHAGSAQALQELVDAALYEAKAGGRNGVSVHDPRRRAVCTVEEQQAAAVLQSHLKVAESLIRLVDARDTYTGRHSNSVAMTSVGIATQLGLEPAVVEQVRLAALLHDLGKILLADEILQKPSALTDEEAALVRTHPELGASLLVGLQVDPVGEWVKHHHEHWDGTGYPNGLAGEEIPLGSRIILVADTFDALTSDRSYRPAVTRERALGELRSGAGQQFDPMVVAAFEAHLEPTEDPLARVLRASDPPQLTQLVA